MTPLLARLLGRLPIGWLQLSHSRLRLVTAVAGVAFANILVFVQLGMLGALTGTITVGYELFEADILISAADANTLSDGSPVARRHMYRALAVPGVEAAAPLYLARADWTRPDGGVASVDVYGLPPEAARFAGPAIAPRLDELRLMDTVLVDELTRGLATGALGWPTPEDPFRFELNGEALAAIGTLAIGGGFAADGAMVVSDQTFLRLFPSRISGTPSHILVAVEPGRDAAAVSARIAEVLDGAPVRVRTLAEAIDADVAYQTRERPVGVIFGFGVFIGILVGFVIVYQVLSTDVADHIREYATFKAMGYAHRFFIGIVLEEAILLALLGFVPGVVVATALYAAMSAATGLPVAMDGMRAVLVLAGTIVACAASGALATRRLAAADPADLF